MKINRKHIQNSFVHILGFLFHFIFFGLLLFCQPSTFFYSYNFVQHFDKLLARFIIYIQQPDIIHSIKMLLTKIRLFARTMFGLSVIWKLCSARSQTFNRSNALQLLLFLLRKCIELEINSKVCVRACVCVWLCTEVIGMLASSGTPKRNHRLHSFHSLYETNERKKNITQKKSSVWVCVW